MPDVSVELLHDGGQPLDAAHPLNVTDAAALTALTGIRDLLDTETLTTSDPTAHGLLEAVRALLVGPVPVDIGGEIAVANLTVQYESKVSTVNSTQTPLAAGESFVGAWEDVRDYATISVAVMSDAMSAINGAVVEFSEDPVKGAIRSIPTTILAGSGAHFSLAPQARYFRLRYTNGATAQTVMRSETSLKFNPPAQVQQPLAAPTTDANLATIVKSHLAGRQATGAWTSLLVNSSGHLSVRTENQPTTYPLPPEQVTALAAPATQPVSGTVTVGNPGLTDGQLRAAPVPVSDNYTVLEPLPDQSGAGAVLTFTFAAPRALVWVLSRGAVSRASLGTPTSTLGVYCDDGIPTPITVTTSTVKVFAPAGSTVSVWGFA